MSNKNEKINEIIKPYEKLLNAWIDARDHALKLAKETNNPALINNVEKLNENIDILQTRIKNFKDTYFIKNT